MADEGLISLSTNLTSPRLAKPSDFGKADNSHEAMGQDQRITLNDTQSGPRHIVDGGRGSGYGTPAAEDIGAKLKAAFPISTSKGEGGAVMNPKNDTGVDFKDGKHTWAGSDPLK